MKNTVEQHLTRSSFHFIICTAPFLFSVSELSLFKFLSSLSQPTLTFPFSFSSKHDMASLGKTRFYTHEEVPPFSSLTASHLVPPFLELSSPPAQKELNFTAIHGSPHPEKVLRLPSFAMVHIPVLSMLQLFRFLAPPPPLCTTVQLL